MNTTSGSLAAMCHTQPGPSICVRSDVSGSLRLAVNHRHHVQPLGLSGQLLLSQMLRRLPMVGWDPSV